MTATPRLGAPQVADASATPGTDCNEQCAYFDQGANHFTIVDRDLTAPPGTPRTDACYLVKATGTGAWAGHDGDIAFMLNGSWTFIDVKEGMSLWIEDEDAFLVATSATTFTSFTAGNPTESIIVACSDESTALTAGTTKVTFRMPYAFTLTAVRASLATAQATNGAGGIFTVDINESGTSVLSTKLTIDNTEKTSTTAAAAAVISDSALADDAEMTVDIDQVGDGTAKGLKVVLIGHR